MQTEEEVDVESVRVHEVMGRLASARNRMNVVILDACRNNPFARSFRSATRGLAFMSAPAETLIAYATAPGQVAAEGSGRDGLYTEKLLDAMRIPGLAIEDVFKRTRSEVKEATGRRQEPWESSNLTGTCPTTSRPRPGSASRAPTRRTTPTRSRTTRCGGRPEIRSRGSLASTRSWGCARTSRATT